MTPGLLPGFGAVRWSPMAARGVLIGLDVSSDARDSLPEQLRLALAVIDLLPADAPVAVTALGAECAWPPGMLQDADWLASQADRLAIVAPGMEQALKRGATLVAMAGGPIPDIEDLSTEESSRLLVIPMKPELRLADAPTAAPRAAEIVDRLVRRTESITIGAPDSIPVDWPEDGWRVELTADGKLQVRPTATPGPITLEYAGQPPMANGERLHPAENYVPAWIVLPPAECAVLEAILAGRPFTCPVCGRTHPPDTLLCPNGSGILEPPVLPSTPPGAGLVQATRTGSNWRIRRVRGCLPLPDGDAVMYAGSAPLRLNRQPDATWRRAAAIHGVIDCGEYFIWG